MNIYNSIDFKLLNNYTFLPEAGREVYFLYHFLLSMGYAQRHSIWPVDSELVGNSKNHNLKFFFITNKKNDFFNITLRSFIARPRLLVDLKSHITKIKNEAVVRLRDKTFFSSLQNSELAVEIEWYSKMYIEILRAPAILRNIDRAVMPELHKIFRESEDINDCVSTSCVSERKSFALLEKESLLECAIQYKGDGYSQEVTEAIQKIYNSYSWAVLGYFNEKPKRKSDYVLAIQELAKGNPEEKLSEIQKREKNDLRRKQALLKDKNQEEKLLVRIASESIFLKDYYKFSVNEIQYHAEPLFEEIKSRVGWNSGNIKDLSPDEIVRLLEGRTISNKVIQKRIEHHIFIVQDHKLYLLTEKAAQEFEKKFIVVVGRGKKEFFGRVASLGRVRGKVKVVLGTKDFGKFKTGDILVAMNTSPDFVPIMEKAAAIVAEEGGLTAHVSVISREMDIPCIVGVSNITELLKDGDFVEVNANKGIIKKLK